jgi:pilus assembly protein CpaB
MLASRTGTMIAGGFAAILAGAILLFYVAQYRDSVKNDQQPVAVLVAQDLIPKNTPGSVVASQNMYTISKLPQDRVENGAITDPNALKGQVAVQDLYPGKQLTESDFVSSKSNVTAPVTGYARAVSVPLDSAHGLIGYVQPGDHVDVMAGFNITGNDGKQHPILKTIMQNILVLDAPASSGSSGVGSSGESADVVLQMTDEQAADLAFSSDNGKVWIVLRGGAGSLQHQEQVVTLDTLLFGVPAVAITNAFRKYEKQALKGGNG